MSGTRLHLGCGRRVQPGWVNLDLVPRHPDVEPIDLRAPLPYASGCVAAIYHAHALEHLTPGEAAAFTAECRRVLQPGGVLRVVVPDLEKLVRTYLAQVERVDAGEAGAENDHTWAVLHLIDQLVREESGGEMGAWFANGGPPNLDFVRRHLGEEVDTILGADAEPAAPPVPPELRWAERRRRRKLAAVLTDDEKTALARQAFLAQGEVHRWMYDSVTLERHLRTAGFEAVDIRGADDSAIPDFASFGFERNAEGTERKPDSLYMEACVRRA